MIIKCDLLIIKNFCKLWNFTYIFFWDVYKRQSLKNLSLTCASGLTKEPINIWEEEEEQSQQRESTDLTTQLNY